MEIGIVGLGLIGGSLAKAISQNTDNTVYGTDISDQVVKKAVLVEAIEQPLTDSLLSQCDIIIVALYPQATIEYVEEKAHLFKKGCIVFDCGGVKRGCLRQTDPVFRGTRLPLCGRTSHGGPRAFGIHLCQTFAV